MNKEQLEVLNVTQEVLRGVVMAFIALQPEKTAELSAMLAASAHHPQISPMAQAMLANLAQGPAMFASVSHPKQ